MVPGNGFVKRKRFEFIQRTRRQVVRVHVIETASRTIGRRRPIVGRGGLRGDVVRDLTNPVGSARQFAEQVGQTAIGYFQNVGDFLEQFLFRFGERRLGLIVDLGNHGYRFMGWIYGLAAR